MFNQRNISRIAWMLALTVGVLFFAGAGNAHAQQKIGSTKDVSIGGDITPPILSPEHTPVLVFNSKLGVLEMVVPSQADGYTFNLVHGTYDEEKGWVNLQQITFLPHDVKNVDFRLVGETAYVVFEAAESIDRVYIMVRDKKTGSWSSPVLVSAADTPSHEPKLLVVNDAVTVVFRTSSGDSTQSKKVVVVAIQENIPIW
jgi:hypothetical protein